MIPVLLFLASAAFVVWRNLEVGVLVDIAYILNTATRIAAGDVPYAHFPLAQAPGEFLIQAALVKAFGPHFVVQIAYVATLGGLATAMTFVIARRLLRDAVAAPTLVAAVLAVPLIPLGVYAVYPHPFYDSDACVLVLAAIVAVLVARDQPTPPRWTIAGVLLTLPLFMKQNIGGAFLFLMLGALAVEAVARPSTRRGFRWCAGAAVVALALEVGVLQLIVGVDKYLEWAWTFALAGRGVSAQRIRAFVDPAILFPGAVLLALVAVAQRLSPNTRTVASLGGFALLLFWVVLTPALLIAAPLFFPPILLAACALAVVRALRDGLSFETLLPLVMTGTILGTLQSLGLIDSAFGIFPLLVVATASLVRDLARFVGRPSRIAPFAGVAVAALLTIAGTRYTLDNVRLLFVDVNAAGGVHRSSFSSLIGLSARGPYTGELDAMLGWARDNVPADDPVVFLPGEDPAYFALARRPPLPSVYFYDVATPYTPEELARFADAARVRWVVVKDRLQLREEPPRVKALTALLTERAALVAQIGPYRVFRRS